VTALVTSSDSANATRPSAGLGQQWTSTASSASSFLTPAVSPGRRGSSAEPPSRRRGLGLDDDDDEGSGGGDHDDDESSDDDEEENGDDENKEERRRKRSGGGGGGGVAISRSDDTTLFRENGNESSGGSGGSARFQRKKEKRESYTRLMEVRVLSSRVPCVSCVLCHVWANEYCSSSSSSSSASGKGQPAVDRSDLLLRVKSRRGRGRDHPPRARALHAQHPSRHRHHRAIDSRRGAWCRR